jgi:hypothetical protein
MNRAAVGDEAFKVETGECIMPLYSKALYDTALAESVRRV